MNKKKIEFSLYGNYEEEEEGQNGYNLNGKKIK